MMPHGVSSTISRPVSTQQRSLAATPSLLRGGCGGCCARTTPRPTALAGKGRSWLIVAAAERREYYDFKDMPPLPLTVNRITVPSLGHVVVDSSCREQRRASMAIFYDIYKDDQYAARLNRRSAITALCMYDRDDVAEARANPGAFPNIDLLHRVYNDGMDVEFVVEELGASGSSGDGSNNSPGGSSSSSSGTGGQ